MRISDWSSDVCSSDLVAEQTGQEQRLSSAGSAASDFWQTAGIGKPLRKRFQNGAEFRIAYITQTLSHVAGHGLQHFGRRTPFRFATFHLTLTHGHLGDRIVAKETVHALDNLWQHVLHHRCEATGDDQTQGDRKSTRLNSSHQSATRI